MEPGVHRAVPAVTRRILDTLAGPLGSGYAWSGALFMLAVLAAAWTQ